MANMNLSDAVKIVQSLLEYQKQVRIDADGADDTSFFIMLSDDEWDAIEELLNTVEGEF